MNLEEYVAKARLLRPAGIPISKGADCATPDEAARICADIGPCVVKAQVPAGKRGKAGGIKLAATPEAAATAAAAILGMTIGGFTVERVLVEERADIAREYYAAILLDVASRGPILLFSTEGGMDIEEIAASRPDAIRQEPVDVRVGFTPEAAERLLKGIDLGPARAAVIDVLHKLYALFRASDGELIEINPLAVLHDGSVRALDCKFVLDDASAFRQRPLAAAATPETMTALEKRGAAQGLKYIQLDGNVGVLANGAGLTMTTMDVIHHFGGRPANFLEIGGEAYTKAELALELVLSNPGVKSLVVNFCGAFARTDVMAEGVVLAWEKLQPKVPAFFSVHGTGEEEAVRLVRERLGIEPYEFMEDAIRAAVEVAQ
jgi:succinyl-CoA synthetase beta subunit